ncbi:hypothetical protein D3C80_712000 [compost metagenome]
MGQHFVDRALHAFRGGAVVAEHIEDQGVVAFALALQFVEDFPSLGIGMLHEAGKHFHQACLVLLLLRRQAVPSRQFRRTRCEPGVLGNEAQRLLASEGLLAVCIPATRELALVLVRPLGIHLMRAMHGTRGPIEEEGFVRRIGLLVLQPVHRAVGQVFAEVVLRAARWFDRRGALVQARFVLGGFAGQEAIEMLKAIAGRPTIERTGSRDLERRGVVPFAEGGGAVAVLLEHLGHGRRALGDFPGIAVPVGGQFRDHAVADPVMVAPGQQRSASCRADRRSVKGVVAHAAVGNTAQGGGMDSPADGIGLREAGIVEHDHQDVRCICRQVRLLLTLLVPGVL